MGKQKQVTALELLGNVIVGLAGLIPSACPTSPLPQTWNMTGVSQQERLNEICKISTTEHVNGVSHFSLSKTLQVGMGWNRLANTGVATAQIEMTKFYSLNHG